MLSSLKSTKWQAMFIILVTVLTLNGCSEEAKKDLEKAKAEAAKEADKLGDKAGEAGEKIKEGASALNEKAVAFLGPIKEKIGGLDQLKDKPAELKKAVEGLIATIESKAEALNLPVPLAALLVQRGHHTTEAARRFLRPELASLADPLQLAGMDAAVAAITAAAAAGDTVLVHGDYDVDGQCATALLVRTLRAAGITAHGFVPNRLRDGYERLVRGIVAARWLLMPVYLVVCGLIIWLVGGQLGREIFPLVDTGAFRLRLRAADGTHIAKSEETARQALDIVAETVGRQNVELTLGYVGMIHSNFPVNAVYQWSRGPEEAILYVDLRDDAHIDVEQLNRLRH